MPCSFFFPQTAQVVSWGRPLTRKTASFPTRAISRDRKIPGREPGGRRGRAVEKPRKNCKENVPKARDFSPGGPDHHPDNYRLSAGKKGKGITFQFWAGRPNSGYLPPMNDVARPDPVSNLEAAHVPSGGWGTKPFKLEILKKRGGPDKKHVFPPWQAVVTGKGASRNYFSNGTPAFVDRWPAEAETPGQTSSTGRWFGERRPWPVAFGPSWAYLDHQNLETGALGNPPGGPANFARRRGNNSDLPGRPSAHFSKLGQLTATGPNLSVCTPVQEKRG